MPKFIFGCKVTVSAFTEVEADTIDQARAIAEKRSSVSLGGAGSGAYPDEEWVIEEADGSPHDIDEGEEGA